MFSRCTAITSSKNALRDLIDWGQRIDAIELLIYCGLRDISMPQFVLSLFFILLSSTNPCIHKCYPSTVAIDSIVHRNRIQYLTMCAYVLIMSHMVTLMLQGYPPAQS
jgi:hypothetical protein